MPEALVREDGSTVRLDRLQRGDANPRSVGRTGMLTLVVTEASLFSYLLFSYFYLLVVHGADWLPGEPPSLRLSGTNTVILIASSVAVWYGERAARRGARAGLVGGFAIACVLGAVFVAIQLREWADQPFGLTTHAYGSIFFTVTGFHMAHVLAGLAMLLLTGTWGALGYFDETRNAPVGIAALYWHFVDAVWLAVFATFYLTPRLG